jgi:hypothetical protein
VIVATAVVFYPGIGLVLPLVLGSSDLQLVGINVFGVMSAAVVSVGWLAVRLEANRRRHLVEWTTNIRLLTSEEFEWLVGEVYRREDWRVRETGRQDRPDGNVDVELTKGRERRLVQCKRWTSNLVGVNDIRAFAGTLMREGMTGRDGIFVTLSSFNEHAHREAAKVGMTLVDGRDLYKRVEDVRRAEPCPECGHPMMLDRSPHGWWLRRTASGCAGKRHLDRDPSRVVDILLLQPRVQAASRSATD